MLVLIILFNPYCKKLLGQYNLLLKQSLPMSSMYSRANYSPYTKGSTQESEQLPLRSKAFSQIDNTAQNYSQSQYTNGSANQDKISEIKKKYEKLLSKSSNKSNQENVTAGMSTHDYGKSVSNFEANDENSKWSMYSRSYQTPTTNKQRKNLDPYEGVQAKNVNPRPYAQRDYYNQSKTDIKSQLQSNRVTLNAMKSELQSKLNDLTAKTTGSSMLRNPSNPPKQPERKEQMDSSSYEAILSKYSKNISQNRGKSVHETSDKNYQKYRDRTKEPGPIQRIETLETKIKETVISSYIPKYTSSNKNNLTAIQKIARDKQLSTISQISNSNHSQNPSYQVENKENKQKIYEKYRQIQSNVRENAESNIIIERPISNMKPAQTNNWIRSTTSQISNHHPTTAKPQQHTKNNDFTLHKLESSQGFSITRTVTQENFKNMNKINQIQARLQQRQRQFSAMNSQGKTTEHQKYQPTPTPATYNKSIQENTVNQSQNINDEKSEIQKLKEKYSMSSNKYTNPYREKKNDSSSKYIKESTPAKEVKEVKNEAKIEKQVKNEPRNNEVISKQIEKLDMKIKQIQQNKKDLNINFRPYDISKSVSKPPTPEVSQTLTSNVQKAQQRQRQTVVSANVPTNSASYDRNKYNLRYQAYLERVKPLYSQITLPESTKTESSGFAIKLMPVECNNDEASQTDRSEVSSKSRIQQYKNKVELENRTDSGIEERKKRLQDRVEISNTIKNLVKSFGQQAVLDEVFRNNKIWFASQRDQKWAELKKQLNLLSINLSQSDLKSIFNLEESQNNPFFSVSDNKCNMKTLAQSYKQAQTHWQQKIVRKFNRNDLEKEGLTSSKIDYDKKGHIEIEDLVRFLNIQSGSFLRNRDVSIIFKRISNNGCKLSFNQFLSAISE